MRRGLVRAAAGVAGAAFASRLSTCDAALPDTISQVVIEQRPQREWIEVQQRRLADQFVDWTNTSVAYAAALRTLRGSFALPLANLSEMRDYFANEARAGLVGDKSSLAMLPTYVTKRVTGDERGHFFALDLGGTNFRVLRVTLEGGGVIGQLKQAKYFVPEQIKTGSGENLFGFLADAVAHFVANECGGDPSGPVGFTFSFPVEQTSINAGKLLFWNKGFTASGVEDKDVVSLLQNEFEARGIGLTVKALANDTVGTMEAAAYRTPNATVGVIFGTGTNGAYIEKGSALTKWQGAPCDEMVVNTEWGNLDMTRYMNGHDVQIDGASSNPGRQTFEKMVSGMYLGDLVRVAILSPAVAAGFSIECRQSMSKALQPSGSFATAVMAACEADTSADLSAVERALGEAGVRGSTLRDRVLVREACVCVSTRAARLSAMSVVGLLDRLGEEKQTTVAVDGTVFECYPYFKERMEFGLELMLGRQRAREIDLILAKDGSGVGAAIIAAIASQ